MGAPEASCRTPDIPNFRDGWEATEALDEKACSPQPCRPGEAGAERMNLLFRAALVIITGAILASCGRSNPPPDSVTHGRFLGVGVYSAGLLWSKMAVGSVANAATATTADDEHIIVVVDSQTGEVRECGDYSGICASFNPWTKAVAGQQIAPVKLTKHAADLAAEARPATNQGR